MAFRRTLAALGMAFVTCAGAFALPATASAAPVKPGPGAPAQGKASSFVVRQGKLTKFTTWIQEDNPGISRSGFLTTVYNTAHLRITVLWSGRRTRLLNAIAAEGRKRGIGVRVEYRKFGLAQLDAAAAYSLKHASSLPGFKVIGVGELSANYDGIDIQGYYQHRSPAAVAAVKAFPALVASRTGVAAKVTLSKPASNLVLRMSKNRTAAARKRLKTSGPNGTRTEDYSPYSSGGFMYSPSYQQWCSAGFGINKNGGTRVLIARHCAYSDPVNMYDINDYEADNYAADKYGSIWGESGNAGMASWTSAAAFGSMFYGGPGTGTVENIVGFADVGLNAYICTSGGNSGTHCNIKVVNMKYMFSDGYGAAVETILSQQVNGTIAAMEGDSGGPIYQFDGTNYWAVGMIQYGINQLSSCGSANVPAACFNEVGFSSVHTILNNISGSSLVTN